VLAQLGLNECQRQPGAEDRDVRALTEQVGHCADVVLMPMGEDQPYDVIEAVPDVVEVGEDQVDPRLVVLWEEHAAVDDQELAVELEDGHVATDLTKTAERDNP
jgi:hypothetical protein